MSARDLCMQEVAEAEYSASVLDLLGRPLVTSTPEWAEVERELAAERAAICAEAGSVGLVSVPTSGRVDSAYRSAQRSASLRAALKATETDKARRRIALMRRSVGFSARAIQATAHERGRRHGYLAMVTLTYRPGCEWEPRHISDAIKSCRRWHAGLGIQPRYVWVGELQTRGALHYHAVFWMPHGVVMPKWDMSGWWPHGMSKGESARDAVAYLMKYVSKGTDASRFPKGARMHGAGGVEHTLRRARRWLGLPGFVQARADIADDWRRAPGGGWANPDGVVIPSEYARAWLGDRWGVLRVADYGRPFDPSGPFSWLPQDGRRGLQA